MNKFVISAIRSREIVEIFIDKFVVFASEAQSQKQN
jgi:hypothetical protein